MSCPPDEMENTIEYAIRTTLYKALKTLEFKKYDVEREDFVDVLIEDVMDIMFPKQTKVSEVTLPTVMDVEDEKKPVEDEKKIEEEKPKKKAGRKPKAKTEEEKPVEEKKPEEEEKKPVEEEKPAEKKKPGPKPKPKGDANIDKLTPTQTKKLKTIAETHKVEFDKKPLLDYLNSLTKEEFDGKKLEDHANAFYNPTQVEEKKEETKDVEMTEIEFEGQMYLVDETTKRVYVQKFDPDGNPTVTKSIGYVGMAKFEKMKLDA